MKVAERFSPATTFSWATTYTFEPEIFEEYLLRRLGQPPLNAVVLVDFERHRTSSRMRVRASAGCCGEPRLPASACARRRRVPPEDLLLRE